MKVAKPEEGRRKIQVTITPKQFEFLKRKQIYSPSRILQAALDELMQQERELDEIRRRRER